MERFGAGGIVAEVLLEGGFDGSGVAVLRTSFQPGSIVPLHAHPEAEVHTILEGTLDIYRAGAWASARVADRVSLEPGDLHAMRNAGPGPAVMLSLLPASLLAYVREAAPRLDDPPGEPSPGNGKVAVAEERRSRGYLNASRAENEAIGIVLG